MAIAVLNIGLSANNASYPEAVQRATVEWNRHIAMKYIGLWREVYVEFRDDLPEPTLVVLLFDAQAKGQPDLYLWCSDVCKHAKQDCIAVRVCSDWFRNIEAKDYLIGPKSAEWEPFDSTKFVLPTRRMP